MDIKTLIATAVKNAVVANRMLELLRADMLEGQDRKVYEHYQNIFMDKGPGEPVSTYIRRAPAEVRNDFFDMRDLYDEEGSYAILNGLISTYRDRRMAAEMGKIDWSKPGAYVQSIEVASRLEEELSGKGNTAIRSGEEIMDGIIQGAVAQKASGSVYIGIPFRSMQFQKLQNSWIKKNLYTITSRPGQGKTAFSLEIADQCLEFGFKPAFVSLEMDRAQLINRILSIKTGIDEMDIMSGQFSDAQYEKMRNVQESYDHYDIIGGTEVKTWEHLSLHIRRLARRGADMVIVDYLQLIRMERPNKNRSEDIAIIANGLADLARSQNIVVIALSQATRETDKTSDKIPMLGHDAYGSAIEHAASVMMGLCRPFVNGLTTTEDGRAVNPSETWIRFNKGRIGKLGAIRMIRENTRYRDYNPDEVGEVSVEEDDDLPF